MRLQHLKITMRSSGFHHLCVKMRLRRANYGIDMDQQLIGLLRTSDPNMTLLVPEASTSQNYDA